MDKTKIILNSPFTCASEVIQILKIENLANMWNNFLSFAQLCILCNFGFGFIWCILNEKEIINLDLFYENGYFPCRHFHTERSPIENYFLV